ncbi:hypothetical protein BP6252_03248 [Coleophoma cylindrospora]|uniref:Uncharacterized protein n=1 Tax=Coleophoma cylindrospora TaxID=1849047 RepID=A0A3D8S785_9HELO|nr:hypothetical protein BP6252_03248 [Coleophoma cylindrospora]
MAARVTRSRKIDISEDHTAAEVIPSFPASALLEVNYNIPTEEKGIAAELKGLKAAYKQAIGIGKKTRKGRGKAKDSQEDPSDVKAPVLDSDPTLKQNTHVDPPPPYENLGQVDTRCDNSDSILQASSPDDLVPNTGRSEMPPQPNIRMTRRQAAQKQEDRPPCFLRPTEPVSPFPDVTRLPFSGFQAFPISYLITESPLEGRHHVPASASAVSTDQTSVQEAPQANLNPSYLAEKALDNFLNKNIEKPEPVDNTSRAQVQDHDQQIAQKPRSPFKPLAVTLEDVERLEATNRTSPIYESDDDSFIEVITSRSPARSISRIEDSVEALDRFEEAIDTLQEVVLARSIPSPQKKVQGKSSAESSNRELTASANGFKSLKGKPTAPRASILKRASSMTFKKPSETEPSVENTNIALSKKVPVKRPLSLQPPKPSAKSSKPLTVSSFELPGEAIARRLKEQKEARLAQRELAETKAKAPPKVTLTRVRSTKAPTIPSFELPGEAISRRKREAHEAKLKAQEEEERKKREFKAAPLRTSLQPVTLPRDNAASLARRSRLSIEGSEYLSIGHNGANVGAHRPPIAQVAHANTSAPRGPGPSITRQPRTVHTAVTRKVSGGSNSSTYGLSSQRAISATDVQAQKQRAREIYNRDQRGAEDFEREKREREAAAKLAREAAAERGRQASREWAEKQKLKKAGSLGRAGMGERVKEMLHDRSQGLRFGADS